MVYLFVALIAYVAALLFGVAAARSADSVVVSAVTNVISALLPIAVLLPSASKQMLTDNRIGIIYATLGGVCIAVFTVFLNKSFHANPVGIVTPIVFGGAIFMSTLLSYFIFKEKINLLQGIGLVFLAVGFVLITVSKLRSNA